MSAAVVFTVTAPRAAALSVPDVPAASYVIAESGTNNILLAENADERRTPDDMTKIMTALLAAEAVETGAVSPDEVITARDTAWFDITAKSETAGIQSGERMTFRDYMFIAFIGGGNEACNIIAERVSGNCAAFIEKMNLKARELGCVDTNFLNTHGQRLTEQYTTAGDMYRIMRAAMGYSFFAEIAGTYKYKTADTEFSAPRDITNSNHMLNEASKYFYRNCKAGKVSATYEGGYACVAEAEQGGLSLVAVVLGAKAVILESDKSTQLQNITGAKTLFTWGFDNFEFTQVLATGELIAKAPVTYGSGVDSVNLRPERNVMLLLPNDLDETAFRREVKVYSEDSGTELMAPIKSGDVLGEVTVYVNGERADTVKLVASTNVDLMRVKYIEGQIKTALSGKWAKIITAAVLVIFFAYAALVVRYNVIRRRRIKAIKEAKSKLARERRGEERGE